MRLRMRVWPWVWLVLGHMLTLNIIEGQLIGHRGVVNVPSGFIYRDQETVSASVRAAVFAKKQELKEKTHHKNIGIETYRLPSYALVSINIPGVRRNKAEIFDFISSRTVVPPIQNRQNIPLTEVELERLALLKSPLSWPYSEERDRIVPFTEKLAQNNAEKFTQSVPASHGIYFSFLPGFESHQGFLYSYSHKL